MKKIATTFIVMMSVSTAYAESELNQFNADLAKYNAAQRQTPKHLIQYRDQNGHLLRTLFNPSRVVSMIREMKTNEQKFDVAMKGMKPVIINYETAFIKNKGQYDAESLDIRDFSYKLTLLLAIETKKNLKSTQKTKDEQKFNQDMNKLLTALPDMVLLNLEESIKKNEFSPEFKPQAIARLSALRVFRNSMLNQNTNRSVSIQARSPNVVKPVQSTSTFSVVKQEHVKPSVVNLTPPQLWSGHLQLNMQASACARKGYAALSALRFSSVVQNETYVYANYDSNRIAVKCVPLKDQSFVYIVVAGPRKDAAERLRNDIVNRMK